MTVSVRRARPDDDAALLDLDTRAWTAESGFPSVQAAAPTAFFTGQTTPDGHLVAELDGRVVGYVRLNQAYPMPEAAHVLAVTGLAVHPDARGHGAGHALLDAAEESARQQSATKIVLHVFATNGAARALYARHGYVEEGRLVREFCIDGHWVDDLALARRLDD